MSVETSPQSGDRWPRRQHVSHASIFLNQVIKLCWKFEYSWAPYDYRHKGNKSCLYSLNTKLWLVLLLFFSWVCNKWDFVMCKIITLLIITYFANSVFHMQWWIDQQDIYTHLPFGSQESHSMVNQPVT